ncbi:DUF5681 domain-containing protein [Defluviimonas aestuarii]|uniref:DUF5681 domain-containing protein n=1 Tax=Albidovulum aestuarii TaxID=1130726 RepID=UPI00249B7C6C|nr:DUF5681 domain-containing protein [Defluviimonas aestuarii]MDI3337933.1 DUF5681 domain-containing protein [Defluviimonas aestuarii]
MAKKTTTEGSKGVGYKNPPKHTQWKKGQSGHPSGKPTKSESLEAKLKKLAGKEIVVIQNGTPVSMTQDEAMLVAVLMKAMKGDMAAVKFVADKLGSGDASVTEPPALKVTAADLKVLEHRADWIGILEEAKAQLAEDEGDTTVTGETDYDAF